MAQIGDLSVTIKVDGANKAIQDLEKVRRQLELISNLARNTAASFATFNTQLRQFSNATNQMGAGFNAGAQGAQRFNYGIQNTTRILKDLNNRQTTKGLLDITQTLAITGANFDKILNRAFSIPMRTANKGYARFDYTSSDYQRDPGRFGTNLVALTSQIFKSFQYNAQQSRFAQELLKTPFGQKIKQVTPGTRNLFEGGYEIPKFLKELIGRVGGGLASGGPIGAMGSLGKSAFGGLMNFLTDFGPLKLLGSGISGISKLFTGLGGSTAGGMALGIGAGVVGGLAAALKLLFEYMKLVTTATIKGAIAISGFVQQAVILSGEIQSLKSANIASIIGFKYGGVASPANLAAARFQSRAEFGYMRGVAEKTIYTLPEVAGIANILKTGGLPLRGKLRGPGDKGFLETVAATGQALGLRGREVELVARMFSRLAFGDFPDPEVGARFGLVRSNPELKKYGFRFGEGGQLTSDNMTNVQGLRNYLKDKFGPGLDITKMDFFVQLATLQDKIGQAMESFATPIRTTLIPLFEALGKRLKEFQDSGVLQYVGNSFATFFHQMTDLVKSDTFKENAAMFLAILNEIPNQLGVLINVMNNMINNIGKYIKGIIDNPVAWLGKVALGAANPIVGAGFVATDIYKMMSGTGILDLIFTQLNAGNSISDNVRRFMNMMGIKRNKKGEIGGLDDTMRVPAITKPLEETAKNTKQLLDVAKKTFDIFDMRRQTIGLGPLGRLGVTGAEFATMGLPFTENRGISIGPITGYNLRHPGSISPGPVRGTTMMERGVRAITRENGSAGRTNRGIRTSR